MRVQFYDDPVGGVNSRDKVRFNQLGLFIYEDGRRIAVGFDITPFAERPSIEVLVTNKDGVEAASLTVIEAIENRFNLTMHLRDSQPSSPYKIEAILYYQLPDSERVIVDKIVRNFDSTKPGEQQIT
jgi:hypothetical protein